MINLFKFLCVLTIDFFYKVKDWFSIYFYSSNLRIVKVLPGKISFKNNRLAIFVVYQKSGIPFYITNVLDSLRRLEIDCLISVNEDLDKVSIDYLLENSSKVILRKNFGRDFCAYKDAINLEDLTDIDKLILLNDSAIYFSKNLDVIFKNFILNEKDISTLFENFDRNWHVQSYFMALSSKVFLSKNFIDFWRKYKPYNSRRHCINSGEIYFSNKVLSHHYYHRYNHYNYIDLYDSLEKNMDLNNLLMTPNKGAISNTRKHFFDFENNKNNKYLNKINFYDFCAELEAFNTSHALAFLGPLVMNDCILKRDIVFRESFTINEVYSALTKLEINQNEINSAIFDLCRKGTVSKLGPKNKILSMLGFL
jgi:hypothetical protein